MPYRDTYTGSKNSATFYVYGYTEALDSGKTAVSITLPTDKDLIILAIDLVPPQLNLSGDFNLTGIYKDGSTFSSTGGVDGGGNALSATQVGPLVNWEGQSFNLGPAGTSDVISAAGQTIPVTPGSYSQMLLLAFGVQGAQTNQQFTVNYSGTSPTFQQSFSDWHVPASYTNELTAVTMSYRDTYAGGESNIGAFYVYGYTETLNSSATAVSITLPSNKDLIILAIDLLSANLTGSGGGGSDISVSRSPSVSSGTQPKQPVANVIPRSLPYGLTANPGGAGGIAVVDDERSLAAPGLLVSDTGNQGPSMTPTAEGWIALPADTWPSQSEIREKK